VERFEYAWQGGQRPALDEFLAVDDRHRLALLVELVHVDLERRLKAGEAVRAESYLQRYRELAADPRLVVDLVAREWELRRRCEPGVTAEEYLQRFPQYREGLTRKLHDALPSTTVLGRLGPYVLRRIIGEGGMGTVYEAEDRQLQRSVAVKAMKP